MISQVRFSPMRRLDAVALNPQPLPPKSFAARGARMWDAVALNPQPLPPRESSRFERVGLNPQPLPPKVFAEVPLLTQSVGVSPFAGKLLGYLR